MNFYIVYETTNNINGYTYSGVHTTENFRVFDGYLGSGKRLKRAIKKYGKQNFTRRTLEVCLKPEYAYEVEAKMVNEKAIKRKDNYNIVVGGKGGCGKHTSEETKKKIRETNIRKGIRPPKPTYEWKEATRVRMTNRNVSDETKRKIRENANIAYGKDHPNSVPVIFNDVFYWCIREACEAVGLTYACVHRLVKGEVKSRYGHTARYATEEEIEYRRG